MLKKVFFVLCISWLLAGCVAYPYRPYADQESYYYEDSQPRSVYVAPPSIYFRLEGHRHYDDGDHHYYRH